MPLKTVLSRFDRVWAGSPVSEFLTVLFALFCVLPYVSHGMTLPPEPEKHGPGVCIFETVTRVIDGDTFELSDGKRVRLIGVDTPETLDVRKEVQWFGKEATKKSREWVEGDTVCLRQDRDRTRNIDKYGRLLRYIWKYATEEQALHDPDGSRGFFVNAELIRQGYAFAYTKYPFQHLEEFRAHEKHARENNLGLWDKKKQAAWEEELARNMALARTCGEEDTICPEDARKYIGTHKAVRFFVERSHDSGKAVFLNSKRNYTDHDNFTAVIFRHHRKDFPVYPGDFYWGKTIDVSGLVREYHGRAEIILKDSPQIEMTK